MSIRFISYLFLSCMAYCGWGCHKEKVDPPKNLQITISVNPASNGEITVMADALGAAYFVVDMGDGSKETKNFTGTATYVYSLSGIYEVTVRAHSSEGAFISSSREVMIVIDNGYTSPADYDAMDLLWQDEFEETALSEEKWDHDVGGSGWGNNELQYYKESNAIVSNGFLHIVARREDAGGKNYTSSRLVTRGKQSFQYGRIDIRARLPEGQGIWPALWLLGNSITSVGWPKCGEIDIMEMIGGSQRENTVHGTLHWDNSGTYASTTKSYTLSTGNFSQEFHVYSVHWDDTVIRWFVDDQPFAEVDIDEAELSEFHAPFYLIFNVAVGGNWPGNPDENTTFPQEMIIDYVRVFQQK